MLKEKNTHTFKLTANNGISEFSITNKIRPQFLYVLTTKPFSILNLIFFFFFVKILQLWTLIQPSSRLCQLLVKKLLGFLMTFLEG